MLIGKVHINRLCLVSCIWSMMKRVVTPILLLIDENKQKHNHTNENDDHYDHTIHHMNPWLSLLYIHWTVVSWWSTSTGISSKQTCGWGFWGSVYIGIILMYLSIHVWRSSHALTVDRILSSSQHLSSVSRLYKRVCISSCKLVQH